jgi:hypothetical protein
MPGGVRRAGARRWLDLTGQDLRDAVALWMHLARRPAPIMMSNEFFKSTRPRLHDAMPAVDLPDPDGSLTARRLDLALGLLRDCGHLQLQADWNDRFLTKAHLAAAGDIVGTLREGDAAIDRFPFAHRNVRIDRVIYARTLGAALADQSVGLRSFGYAIQRMIAAIEDRIWLARGRPVQTAMLGLLPALLRGEAQLGVNASRPVAVRFTPIEPGRSTTRRELAERCRAVPLPTPTGIATNEIPESEDPRHSFASEVCRSWSVEQFDPLALSSRHGGFFDSRIPLSSLLSTLDKPLESVIPSRG